MNRKLIPLILLIIVLASCKKREWNNPFDPAANASSPLINTGSISSSTFNSINFAVNISSDGGTKITSSGACWNTTPNPTIANSKTNNGNGSLTFTSNITGLNSNTVYYVRAYATNILGTSYGNEVSFILYMNVPGTSVIDVEGNVYKTIKIGNQIWMAENLKTTKYRDGTAIPNITDYTAWSTLTSGAYCNFLNNSSNGITYGHLYNFYTIEDRRQICPVGWHIPTKVEWTTLINYLGGEKNSGSKLKESGTLHWNTGGDNSSGFTALGDAWRGSNGSFYYWLGYSAWWWSSTNYDTIDVWCIVIEGDGGCYQYNSDKKGGFNIRCIKDY